MSILEYSKWQNFNNVIQKVVIAANTSNHNQNLWAVEVTTSINRGKGKIEKRLFS